uniref:Uncharacterized protein n=1 Tax=Oryza sativa subsp. japonica TaxID=39947 RepID=Q8H7Z9_ORYSJ|nr:hypothetical protein [Oryza sativa Japonica Group]
MANAAASMVRLGAVASGSRSTAGGRRRWGAPDFAGDVGEWGERVGGDSKFKSAPCGHAAWAGRRGRRRDDVGTGKADGGVGAGCGVEEVRRQWRGQLELRLQRPEEEEGADRSPQNKNFDDDPLAEEYSRNDDKSSNKANDNDGGHRSPEDHVKAREVSAYVTVATLEAKPSSSWEEAPTKSELEEKAPHQPPSSTPEQGQPTEPRLVFDK